MLAAFGAPLTATAEMAVYSNCNAAPRREYSRVGTATPQHESLRGFWEPESIFERFLNAEVGIKVSNSRNLQRFLWSFQTDAGVNRNFRLPTTSASAAVASFTSVSLPPPPPPYPSTTLRVTACVLVTWVGPRWHCRADTECGIVIPKHPNVVSTELIVYCDNNRIMPEVTITKIR